MLEGLKLLIKNKDMKTITIILVLASMNLCGQDTIEWSGCKFKVIQTTIDWGWESEDNEPSVIFSTKKISEPIIIPPNPDTVQVYCDAVITLKDLIDYETYCFNDSTLIKVQNPFRSIWTHKSVTIQGFIKWMKTR